MTKDLKDTIEELTRVHSKPDLKRFDSSNVEFFESKVLKYFVAEKIQATRWKIANYDAKAFDALVHFVFAITIWFLIKPLAIYFAVYFVFDLISFFTNRKHIPILENDIKENEDFLKWLEGEIHAIEQN